MGVNIRLDFLEDREHFVVPVVMLTEGVHSGSNGPLYYPPQELKRSVPHWNGKPVVVYHPELYNQPIAAAEPGVHNRQKIGTVFNTRFDGFKLSAEAWIDAERVRKVDSRVAEAIQSRRIVEVSTGVYSQHEYAPGAWKGERYEYIARHYVPDHLAVLPDQKGACSISDGAGLCRNFGLAIV